MSEWLKMEKEIKLTRKQKAFCENYLANNGNGTQAAKDAGYKENSADVIASQNLRKLSINAYMNKRIEESADKHGMSIDKIFMLLKRGAENALPDLDAAKDEVERERMLRLYSASDAVKCISEHCKITGIYASEKKEITVDTTHMHEKLKEIEEEFEKEY